MIIFHEGMPRSGKSYAALKDHIIPALAKGRKVYARLDGLNYPQIADLSCIDEERCRILLIELSEADVVKLVDYKFDRDSMIVIDEAQNYWQSSRGNLTPDLLKWIAEHGHHGHDVLLMGQLLKDVHRSWTNRVNRKVQFFKKDVVGKANEYKWVMFHGSPDARGSVRFTEVSRGDSPYEDKYFGCYKSHSEGTENKENYVDDRANIFKTAAFRKWLPAYALAALAALGFVIHAFTGGLVPQSAASTHVPEPTVRQLQVPVDQEPVRVFKDGKVQDIKSLPMQKADIHVAAPLDFVDKLTSEARIRASAVWKSGLKTGAIIEWRDQDRILERLNEKQLHALGWTVWVAHDAQLVRLTKGDRQYTATAWPVDDPLGRVPDAQQQQIAGTPPSLQTAGEPPKAGGASPRG